MIALLFLLYNSGPYIFIVSCVFVVAAGTSESGATESKDMQCGALNDSHNSNLVLYRSDVEEREKAVGTSEKIEQINDRLTKFWNEYQIQCEREVRTEGIEALRTQYNKPLPMSVGNSVIRVDNTRRGRSARSSIKRAKHRVSSSIDDTHFYANENAATPVFPGEMMKKKGIENLRAQYNKSLSITDVEMSKNISADNSACPKNSGEDSVGSELSGSSFEKLIMDLKEPEAKGGNIGYCIKRTQLPSPAPAGFQLY